MGDGRCEYAEALVLGLGASGEAAARLLVGEGAVVTAIDAGRSAVLEERAAVLSRLGCRVALGLAQPPAGRFDVCVVSPGIPCDSAWVASVRESGVPVMGELELGARRCGFPLLAVTGSNGKSTVTKLCSEAMREAGLRAEALGNYGRPLCDAVSVGAALDWAVVEVSSFQLELVETFCPQVAVLLNVQPDHLDRHVGMAEYTALKARIFARMTRAQVGIVPCELLAEVSASAGSGVRWVTFGVASEAQFRYVDGCICWADGRVRLCGSVFDDGVMGPNAAAAVAALSAAGVAAEAVQRAVDAFVPLAHRMSPVRTVGGVRFVDDSKATNLSALVAGVQMCGGPVRLVAGGLLKETNLAAAKEVLARHVRGAYLIGAAAKTMSEAWRGRVACLCCDDLGTAVARAWQDAEPGDTVLLSPGCASFDQFRSFEERGERFAHFVNEIEER